MNKAPPIQNSQLPPWLSPVEDRVIQDLTFDEYAEIPALNWSKIKQLRDGSPRELLWQIENDPDSDTSARRKYRAIHARILEPAMYEREFAVYRDGARNPRHKKYQRFLEEHPGKTILKPSDEEQIEAVAKAVHEHPIAGPMIADAQTELTLTWTDRETGLPCKARLDAWRPIGCLVDLKNVPSLVVRRLSSLAARLQWYGQMAHYVAGINAVLDDGYIETLIIAAKDNEPHEVGVMRMEEDQALYAGELERDRLMEQIAECITANQWPPRHETIQTLEAPMWCFPEPDELDPFADITTLTGDSK